MSRIETMEALSALPEGTRVVVADDGDRPYVKVDEEWWANHAGVRLRAKHFSGAITAGAVSLYDDRTPRPWGVRGGGAHYSLIIEAGDGDAGLWRCVTFRTHEPEVRYHTGVKVLHESSLGEDAVEPSAVPWQAFTKSLARELDTALQGHKTSLEGWQTRVRQLESEVTQLRDRFAQANRLRNELDAFLADEGE